MAKKNTSVNLEEDILKYLDEYREENGLSSRNSAIERIILKFQNQEREIEMLKYFEQIVKSGKIKVESNSIRENDNENKGIMTENKPLSEKGNRFRSVLDTIDD